MRVLETVLSRSSERVLNNTQHIADNTKAETTRKMIITGTGAGFNFTAHPARHD
jgi:hypothetical protein